MDFDVISKGAAAHILTYLIEVKDRGIIGDYAWCKIALSVLLHLYFSDFTPIAHEVLKVGKSKTEYLRGLKHHNEAKKIVEIF